MAQYGSPQEYEDNMDVASMKQILTDAGVKFHPASGAKKLSQEMFKLHGGNKKTDEDQKMDPDKLKKIADEILREAKEVKKSQPDREKTYIAYAFNYNLPRKGVNKKNKIMRFVDNYDSLDIEEQNRTGERFRLPPILFRGIQSSEKLRMGNFVGRSVLNTTNKMLQKFIETNRRYGVDFVEYDKEEISRAAMEEDRKITKLKIWVYEQASFDDLVSVLTYLNMKTGSSNYDVLSRISDINRLKQMANYAVKSDPDVFLKAMQSKQAKFIHLVHKAVDEDIIKVSSDGRSIILVENNVEVCQSSISSDWENDLVEHLLTPEGFPLLKRMEKRTGYSVI